MYFLRLVDRLLRSVELNIVAVVVLVESVVFLVAVIWAGLRKKKRIEAQIMLDDDRRLAQRIQSQQTEIEMLTQQLAQLKYRQTTLAEDELMSQRDDVLEDFISENYKP